MPIAYGFFNVAYIFLASTNQRNTGVKSDRASVPRGGWSDRNVVRREHYGGDLARSRPASVRIWEDDGANVTRERRGGGRANLPTPPGRSGRYRIP